MSQIIFRKLTPQRSCRKMFSSYQQYKKYLAADFNDRCGYTDSHHMWFGGVTTFHIDHFKPHKKFPELKTDYANLIYACSYVNILKSDDDPENYLDPCTTDYNLHFYRDTSGTIYANTQSPQAVYMHKKLKLGLARYQVIWLLEKCEELMTQLQLLAQGLPAGSKEDRDLKDLHFELTKEFMAHFRYLTK